MAEVKEPVETKEEKAAKEAARVAALKPHLVNDRKAFLEHLASQPAASHLALAKEHGWALLDLTCACGNEVKRHAVDTRSSIADDLNVKPCPKCGARGAWRSVPHVPAGK